MRTTVVGSYPFPGWLEFASQHLDQFGKDDVAELIDDATRIAIGDQVDAGLDVISDGEQTRLDFNLSFYGYLEGISMEPAPPRRFGPPAHDQRGKHEMTGELRAPARLGFGCGVQEAFAAGAGGAGDKGQHSGAVYAERPVGAEPAVSRIDGPIADALLPIVRAELQALADAGCPEITVDEPSMSCYAYREDTSRFVRCSTTRWNRSPAKSG